MPERRVVVTGLGLVTPIGIGAETYWDALLRGECGISRVQAFDASGLESQIAGELPPFSIGDYIPKSYRKNKKVMSRDIQIAVVCAHQAATDAALPTVCLVARGEAQADGKLNSTRFGANIGAGLICADLPELAEALGTAVDEQTGKFSIKKWGEEGMSNLTPLWLLKFLPNMLACHVTIVHDAQAVSNTITCGEASSHLAIGEAFRTIARGAADVCICGGTESKVNPMAMARPLLQGRLNTTANDHPERACRPFGADAAGMVASEGGGLVILEELEHAQSRGARIYCELVGFGAAANTYSWKEPDPEGQAVSLALKKAMADAGVSVDQVKLIVPFGTGISVYDASEYEGWRRVFTSQLETCRAIAVKGLIGTNGAGSGAIDFATSVLAIYHNTVPVSVNTNELTADCNMPFVQGQAVDANSDYAMSLAYALSGSQIGALVIKRYVE